MITVIKNHCSYNDHGHLEPVQLQRSHFHKKHCISMITQNYCSNDDQLLINTRQSQFD